MGSLAISSFQAICPALISPSPPLTDLPAWVSRNRHPRFCTGCHSSVSCHILHSFTLKENMPCGRHWLIHFRGLKLRHGQFLPLSQRVITVVFPSLERLKAASFNTTLGGDLRSLGYFFFYNFPPLSKLVIVPYFFPFFFLFPLIGFSICPQPCLSQFKVCRWTWE